jgi:hypothetical protein
MDRRSACCRASKGSTGSDHRAVAGQSLRSAAAAAARPSRLFTSSRRYMKHALASHAGTASRKTAPKTHPRPVPSWRSNSRPRGALSPARPPRPPRPPRPSDLALVSPRPPRPSTPPSSSRSPPPPVGPLPLPRPRASPRPAPRPRPASVFTASLGAATGAVGRGGSEGAKGSEPSYHCAFPPPGPPAPSPINAHRFEDTR